MAHPLVDQMRFTRSELVRALEGVSPEDAVKRLLPMNCISWIVGHLASHEDAYWCLVAQGQRVAPELYDVVRYGGPPSTPDLGQMWDAWRRVTGAADVYLDSLTSDRLAEHLQWKGKPTDESVGTMLQRVIYHYWYHLGEAHAIRQMLGHRDLPQFVGDMTQAPYRPESE